MCNVKRVQVTPPHRITKHVPNELPSQVKERNQIIFFPFSRSSHAVKHTQIQMKNIAKFKAVTWEYKLSSGQMSMWPPEAVPHGKLEFSIKK